MAPSVTDLLHLEAVRGEFGHATEFELCPLARGCLRLQDTWAASSLPRADIMRPTDTTKDLWMTQEHKKNDHRSGPENESEPHKKRDVLSSQKTDSSEAATYWTSEEMARAKPRSLSRKPKKMDNDNSSDDGK